MVNIRDAVGSEGKYLKAADLQGREWALIISGIQQEDVSSNDKPTEMKWILYFQQGQKGLVLNVTNGNTIADIHGNETDNWPGKQITLFPTQVDFGGKQVPAIRVKMQQPQNFQAPPSLGPGSARQSAQSGPVQQPAQNPFAGQPAGPAPSQMGYPEPTNVQTNANLGSDPQFEDSLDKPTW